MIFEWTAGYSKVRLRVSLVGGNVMFTTPDTQGDTSFIDPIPLSVWKEINLWVESQELVPTWLKPV
jgi:hypothetical protein